MVARRLLAGMSSAALLLAAVCGAAAAEPVQGYAKTRVEEPLGRGLTVQRLEDGSAYLSWRLLESDGPDAAFHVGRATRPGQFESITKEPLRTTTDFVDTGAQPGHLYAVRVDGVSPGWSTPVAMPEKSAPYRSIKLQGDYTFQKAAIADLDGDGNYDFVLKWPNDNVDPYVKYWKRSTDTFKLEAYRHDGTFLWRYDMGWAIERGIWYSPYVVHDLDGDGKAEVALKAGEGDPRDAEGKVASGPEYLLVLDGATGKERTRVDWPTREGFEGESGYNYFSRNQMCVAYLDGKTPCLVALRGTYNIMKAVAYQMVGGQLEVLWKWDNVGLSSAHQGQGAHGTHAVDLDGDGRDEIVLGSMVLDDDGTVFWTNGKGHPDHVFVGELDPMRPGLEIYYGYERRQERDGMCMADAKTGQILWGLDRPTRHVHSNGMCADIDPRHPGAECYSADTDAEKKAEWARLHSATGEVLSEEMPWGFGPKAVYWDADPQKELLREEISDYETGHVHARIEGSVIAVVDLEGDWREELITTVEGELRIYATTIPAKDRRVTLMQDPLYRMDVVAGAMGYYMVPMVSYDMASTPAP